MPLDGQMRQEALDLGCAERDRMAKPLDGFMEMDVLSDPADITLFRALGVAFHAQTIPDLFEQFHRSFLLREFARALFAVWYSQTLVHE
jgi:hypothetical protein